VAAGFFGGAPVAEMVCRRGGGGAARTRGSPALRTRGGALRETERGDGLPGPYNGTPHLTYGVETADQANPTSTVLCGVLELASEAALPLTPAELIAEAERLAASGAWDPAMTAAAQAFTTAPDNKAVAAAYRRIERARVATEARRLLVTADGRSPVPVLRRGGSELADLELGDLERRLVHAIDGRWDLLTLVQHAPVRPAEALVVFARLIDRGIVELP